MKSNRVQIETMVAALIVSGDFKDLYQRHVDELWRSSKVSPKEANEFAIGDTIALAIQFSDAINALDLPGSIAEQEMASILGLQEKLQTTLKPAEIPDFCHACGYMYGHHQKDCPLQNALS